MQSAARSMNPQAQGKPQLLEPPGADPHAGWCGRAQPIMAAPYADEGPDISRAENPAASLIGRRYGVGQAGFEPHRFQRV